MAHVTDTPRARPVAALPSVRARLYRWSRRAAALFAAPSERDRRMAEALAILRSGRSSLDRREWAERYLCGLVDTDAPAYLATCRAQT